MKRIKNPLNSDWHPPKLSEKDLIQPSLLWTDTNVKKDLEVIVFLVNHFLPISRNKDRESAVSVIYYNLIKKEWNKVNNNKIFVFCAMHSQMTYIGDIETMLLCQSLEVIFMNYFPTRNPLKTAFGEKVKLVYEKIYEREMSEDKARLLTIMRNLVSHTGECSNASNLEVWQKEHIKKCHKEFYSKQDDVEHMLTIVSINFNYLMSDLVLRVLGLTWDELKFNLSPPYLLFEQR